MKTRFQPQDVTQRGSALLLSLGILSLVLILAMSFAYTSNTRLRIAKSQGNSSDARVLADRSVQLIMSDMLHLFEATEPDPKPTKKFDTTIYPPETMVSAQTYNQDLLLFERYNGGGSDCKSSYQSYAVSHNNYNDDASYPDTYLGDRLGLYHNNKWMTYTGKFVNDKEGYPILSDLPQLAPIADELQGGLSFAQPLVLNYSVSDGNIESATMRKVIGRYGYVLLDETNKLSINSLLNLTGKETAATYDFIDVMQNGGKYCDRLALREELSNVVMTQDSYFPFDTSLRLGLIPEEIGADNIYLNNLDEFPEGSGARIGWQSNDQLCAKVNGSFYDNPNSDYKESDLFVYTPLSMQDIEAWWDEAAGAGTGTGTEMARFDLTGASWGKSDPNDFKGNFNADKGQLDPAKTGWAVPTTGASAFTQAESEELVLRLAGYTSKPADRTPALSPMPQLEFWDERAKGLPNYSVEKTTNDSTCVGYLNWLQYMVDDDGNSVTLDVAANIKDYSDTDNYASTDFTPTATTESDLFKEPLFCGNEKVAYINEVALKSGFSCFSDSVTGEGYNVRIYAAVELLNLYCNQDVCSGADCAVLAGHVKVKFTGKLRVFQQTFEYVQESSGGDEGKWQKKGDCTQVGSDYPLDDIQELSSLNDGWYDWENDESGNPEKVSLPKTHLGYNTIYMRKVLEWEKLKEICSDLPIGEMKPISDPVVDGTTKTIYAFYVVFDKCVAYTYGDDTYETNSLYDVASLELEGNKNYCVDTSKLNKDYIDAILGSEGELTPTYDSGPFNSIAITVDFESQDSRCNHRKGDIFWTVNKWEGEKGTMTEPEETLNKNNKKFKDNSDNDDPTADKDMEKDLGFPNDQDKNRTYSTAYIRNEPMRSLWELGAIHRGYPNQTINLKQFTEKADWATTDKVVTYAKGDAGMLDQVKIGPLLFVEGKVNANMRNPLVWKKLLDDIDYLWYDPSIENFTVFGQEKQKGSRTELDLGNAWSNLERPTSYSRGAVARMLQSVLQGKAKNDRDWEAYIGKTAQLLTTRCELYSLLVYAESLEDITEAINEAKGGPDKKLDNELKSELEHVLGKWVDIDITGEPHYCKVKGSQKILVHLQRDAWRNIMKMIDKRYLEE